MCGLADLFGGRADEPAGVRCPKLRNQFSTAGKKKPDAPRGFASG